MNKKIFFAWLVSLIFVFIWTIENPDKIETLRSSLKIKFQKPDNKIFTENISENKKTQVIANSFKIEVEKVFSLGEKTTFVLNNSENKKTFKKEDVTIFTQTGFLLNKQSLKKLKLHKNFTLKYNGGIKTLFFYNQSTYGLASSFVNDCHYASIVNFTTGIEIFKTKCLPDTNDKVDFNGLGSSFAHKNDSIIISLGTPTRNSTKISNLAQNQNSNYGKILKIKKEDLNKKKIQPTIFSSGHRTPQGVTQIENKIFSVEHGPKGGDELNKIEEAKNYGWPYVSYGTRYLYDEEGRSYKSNHQSNNFAEPLFSLVPSVGITAVNKCPEKIYNHYKKNCIIALSLYGNSLRTGRSLLIFLLDENFNQVHSVEKIFLGNDYTMRHFMTNSKNELYEDDEGSIYVSVDKKGIFKISFNDFR